MLSSSFLPRWLMSPMAWPFRRLAGLVLLCVVGVSFLASQTLLSAHSQIYHSPKATENGLITQNALIAQYFVDYPVQTSEFGEMGRRIQMLTSWMNNNHITSPPNDYTLLLEKLAISLFPFIRNPTNVENDTMPLDTLRKSYNKGSRGIVIPTGVPTFRFACHLILNLRVVLKSTLPIQIVYAGDSDLPITYREALLSLSPTGVEFLDLWEALDDAAMGLAEAKWAIKPFAMLASTFEEVILIDADAVFLQKPEVILDKHKAYRETGVLFFHDRLVGKGQYKARHAWWSRQMRHQTPSSTLEKSITLREGYGQEADSGVVVMNKRSLGVLMGLLHACWQNSKEIREKETYTHTHGDKETYWLGMELSGVEYSFAEHYGAALGKAVNSSVHSSTIAHVDEAKKLLWFNGSLLKRKDARGASRNYYVPDTWMMGGNWTWDIKGEFMAYMDNAAQMDVLPVERAILQKSVEAAKFFDEEYGDLLGLPAKVKGANIGTGNSALAPSAMAGVEPASSPITAPD